MYCSNGLLLEFHFVVDINLFFQVHCHQLLDEEDATSVGY